MDHDFSRFDYCIALDGWDTLPRVIGCFYGQRPGNHIFGKVQKAVKDRQIKYLWRTADFSTGLSTLNPFFSDVTPLAALCG